MRGQNTFTQQQLSDLSHNPYTFSVTPSTIRFTLAFKTLLIQDAQVGLTARKIFAKYGYDPNVLGTDRMRSQFLHIRNEAKSPGGLK